MILTQKKILLIDSLGALLSVFILGVVLVKFESTFGMPRKVLYFLSITAGILGTYSFICYLLIKENRKPYLKIIANANLIYCCITVGLTIYFNRVLTNWGFTYFLCEVAVIIMLAIFELKSASKLINNKA